MLIFPFFLMFFSRSRFRFLKLKTKNEIFTFVSRFQFQKSKTRNDKCKINLATDRMTRGGTHNPVSRHLVNVNSFAQGTGRLFYVTV